MVNRQVREGQRAGRREEGRALGSRGKMADTLGEGGKEVDTRNGAGCMGQGAGGCPC